MRNHVMRTYSGRPSSSMRFSTLTADKPPRGAPGWMLRKRARFALPDSTGMRSAAQFTGAHCRTTLSNFSILNLVGKIRLPSRFRREGAVQRENSELVPVLHHQGPRGKPQETCASWPWSLGRRMVERRPTGAARGAGRKHSLGRGCTCLRLHAPDAHRDRSEVGWCLAAL